MDIDATRKIRPLRGSGGRAEHPAPAPVPDAEAARQRPAARADAGSIPPSREPEPVSPPPDEASQTIRFVPPKKHTDQFGHSAHDPDPVTGWVVVVKGMGYGRSLPLGYGIHSVGRDENQRVSIRFGDKRISRRSHAEICYDENSRHFYIYPGRGSTTPAYLNGVPVLQPRPLEKGDRITLGATDLAFVPFCGESFDWQQE